MPDETMTRELRSMFSSPELDFDPRRDLVAAAKAQAGASRRRRMLTSGIAGMCLIAGGATAVVVRDGEVTQVTTASAFDSWPTRGQGTFGPAALDAWRASKSEDDPTRPEKNEHVLFADDVKGARAAILIATSSDGVRRLALVVGAPDADTASAFELISDRVAPAVQTPHQISAVVPSRQWLPDLAAAPPTGSLVVVPAPEREGRPIHVQLDPDAPGGLPLEPTAFEVMDIGSLDPRVITIRTFTDSDRQQGGPTLTGLESQSREPRVRGEFLTSWAQVEPADQGVLARASGQWRTSRREGLIAVKTIVGRTLPDGTALLILEIDDSAAANHLVLYAEPPGDQTAGHFNLVRDITATPKSFVGWVATGSLPTRARAIVVVGPPATALVRATGSRDPIEGPAEGGIAVVELSLPKEFLTLAVIGYDESNAVLFEDEVMVPGGN